jgi:hypothetical protein
VTGRLSNYIARSLVGRIETGSESSYESDASASAILAGLSFSPSCVPYSLARFVRRTQANGVRLLSVHAAEAAVIQAAKHADARRQGMELFTSLGPS